MNLEGKRKKKKGNGGEKKKEKNKTTTETLAVTVRRGKQLRRINEVVKRSQPGDSGFPNRKRGINMHGENGLHTLPVLITPLRVHKLKRSGGFSFGSRPPTKCMYFTPKKLQRIRTDGSE